MKLKHLVVLCLSLVLPATVLAAQDTTGNTKSKTATPAKVLPAWNGSFLSVGGNMKTGNGASKDFTTKLNATYKLDKWVNSLLFSGHFATSKSKGQTAGKFAAKGESDYFFEPRNFGFVIVSYESDKFSPYNYIYKQIFGYGRRVYDTQAVTVDLKMGPGSRHSQERQSEKKKSEFIIYGEGLLNWHLNEKTKFSQSLIVEKGTPNRYMESVTALTTNLVGHLSAQASFTVQNNSKIPKFSNDKHRTNTITAFALIYNF